MNEPPLKQLRQSPQDFEFDAAVRLLMHAAKTGDTGAAARFAAPPQLAYPAAEVTSVTDRAMPVMTTSVMGMIGPSGVLPRGYTEQASLAERLRSPSLRHFFDLLSTRFVAHFAAARQKYRPHLSAEAAELAEEPPPQRDAVLALVGMGMPSLQGRMACGDAAMLYYAGFFASRTRSAHRLAALASDWLGQPVEVEQFAGAWLDLPPDQRSALPVGRSEGQFCRLGVDAAVGVRAWDSGARVILRIGPLSRAQFEALLPGGQALAGFVALIRAYLGAETGFAVNLVLLAAAVPPLRLGTSQLGGARLGWTSWLTAPDGTRWQDAAEAVFDAAVIEADTERKRAA